VGGLVAQISSVTCVSLAGAEVITIPVKSNASKGMGYRVVLVVFALHRLIAQNGWRETWRFRTQTIPPSAAKMQTQSR
jgi:hypothetical protein